MEINYKEIYLIQDYILKKINDSSLNFYLTGGTCLHRFYCENRFSDDLDLFCNDNLLFRDYIYEIKDIFKKKFEIIIDTKDFVRGKYKNIKIDFVNERNYYYGKPIIKNGIKIDNIKNLFSNKITAIIGRDEAKDIVDICTIYDFIDIDWKEILEIVNKKILFDLDFFIYRIKTFPLELLDFINFTNNIFKSKIGTILNKIINDLNLIIDKN